MRGLSADTWRPHWIVNDCFDDDEQHPLRSLPNKRRWPEAARRHIFETSPSLPNGIQTRQTAPPHHAIPRPDSRKTPAPSKDRPRNTRRISLERPSPARFSVLSKDSIDPEIKWPEAAEQRTVPARIRPQDHKEPREIATLTPHQKQTEVLRSYFFVFLSPCL